MSDQVVQALDGPVESYHQYLATMECLRSGEAKRRWRNSIKQAWNNQCCFCGQSPLGSNRLTLDHLRARCKGGADIAKNLVSCCLIHNQDKGSDDWIQWYRKQSFYDPMKELRIHYWQHHGRLENDSEILRWASKNKIYHKFNRPQEVLDEIYGMPFMPFAA
jgi:hypothetical protein